jgi:hypothetical protein
MAKFLSHEDRVDLEVRALAAALLEKRLAAQGLPVPKTSALSVHIDQLVANSPDLRRLAESRVTASKEAFEESLRAIGLETSDLAAPGVAFDLGEEDEL